MDRNNQQNSYNNVDLTRSASRKGKKGRRRGKNILISVCGGIVAAGVLLIAISLLPGINIIPPILSGHHTDSSTSSGSVSSAASLSGPESAETPAASDAESSLSGAEPVVSTAESVTSSEQTPPEKPEKKPEPDREIREILEKAGASGGSRFLFEKQSGEADAAPLAEEGADEAVELTDGPDKSFVIGTVYDCIKNGSREGEESVQGENRGGDLRDLMLMYLGREHEGEENSTPGNELVVRIGKTGTSGEGISSDEAYDKGEERINEFVRSVLDGDGSFFKGIGKVDGPNRISLRWTAAYYRSIAGDEKQRSLYTAKPLEKNKPSALVSALIEKYGEENIAWLDGRAENGGIQTAVQIRSGDEQFFFGLVTESMLEGTGGEDLARCIIRSVETGNPESGKEAADSEPSPADSGSGASDSGQEQADAGNEADSSVKEQADAGDEADSSVKEQADSGKDKSGDDETDGVLAPSGEEDDNEKRDV